MGFVLWLLVLGLLIVFPFWKIFTKAGFPGPFAILVIIPFVNILLIFYLAFAEWPALKGRTGGMPPQPPTSQ